MCLIDEWKAVLRKAWSIKLTLIAAALSAIEFALQYAAPEHSNGKFAALAGSVSLAAAISRIVAQPKMHKDAE